MNPLRQTPVRLASAVIGMLVAVPPGAVYAQEGPQRTETQMATREKATFAGGCFWCMEGPFDALEGVVETLSGYAGGTTQHPTYQEVTGGRTGHAEAIQITYDPSKVSYEQLLEVFWRQIDPTQVNGQFADHGNQYRTAVFYHDEEQRRQAEASKVQLAQSGKFAKPIVTKIVPASVFYPAEEYHQDYYQKHPVQYKLYRVGSGRDRFLKSTWGDAAH